MHLCTPVSRDGLIVQCALCQNYYTYLHIIICSASPRYFVGCKVEHYVCQGSRTELQIKCSLKSLYYYGHVPLFREVSTRKVVTATLFHLKQILL